MTGVILLNMGGPDSLEAVRPFLQNLFGDRDIIRLGPSFLQKPVAAVIINLRLKKTKDIYGLIGGKSPLREITEAQARNLEEHLYSVSKARPVRVYAGMRYWHPFIADTVRRMKEDGITEVIAVSLYPHYSAATTGSTMKLFEAAMRQYGMKYSSVTSWYDHPGYIASLMEKIEEGLKSFPEKPSVLFSAHSLPLKFIREGDPYEKEIRGTIDALTARISIDWHLSFQSKTGPVRWLGPSTESMLHELAGRGVKDLLVVPISFVSDHVETLYEIDMLYRDLAKGLGINMKRTGALNTAPRFIEALGDIVIGKLKEWEGK